MFAEQKHTAGPWSSVPEPHHERGHPDVERFAIMAGKRPIIDGYVILEEDARLIAAAPDMLAALRRAERELSYAEDGSVRGVPNTVALLIPEALESVRSAIARATGGQ